MTQHHPKPPLIGLAGMMKIANSGVNLYQVGQQLLDRLAQSPDDAHAMMDLSPILHMAGHSKSALMTQLQALRIQQLYHLPAAHTPPALKLLALMGPGDLKVNMPVELLLDGSDVALDMYYMLPGMPISINPQSYDLAIVAVGESDETRLLLQWIESVIKSWALPILNAPGRIGATARDRACVALADAPGIAIPITERANRKNLARLSESMGFPLIVRPVGSHAGDRLIKAQSAADITNYLQSNAEREFFIAPFVDYRSSDGLFRKYRIALVGGVPYACHMAISDQWMIHYLNAGMAESAEKRAEEEQFMVRFDEQFARRHAAAFHAIHAQMRLDYLVIDCGETSDGKLLIFEVDTGAVVHAMDPVDIFPYKQPQMQKVFAAFRRMLERAKN